VATNGAAEPPVSITSRQFLKFPHIYEWLARCHSLGQCDRLLRIQLILVALVAAQHSVPRYQQQVLLNQLCQPLFAGIRRSKTERKLEYCPCTDEAVRQGRCN
jgi:hypothetical protein